MSDSNGIRTAVNAASLISSHILEPPDITSAKMINTQSTQIVFEAETRDYEGTLSSNNERSSWIPYCLKIQHVHIDTVNISDRQSDIQTIGSANQKRSQSILLPRATIHPLINNVVSTDCEWRRTLRYDPYNRLFDHTKTLYTTDEAFQRPLEAAHSIITNTIGRDHPNTHVGA